MCGPLQKQNQPGIPEMPVKRNAELSLDAQVRTGENEENSYTSKYSRTAPALGTHQSQDFEWTLERVKVEVSRGVRIPYGSTSSRRVVDIGREMLVKFGTGISLREAEATKFVAANTSIPVARIYAALYDEESSITYIVQEKLRGQRLDHLLETRSLNRYEQSDIENEFKDVFSQLSLLDSLGSMGRFGSPSSFLGFPFHVSPELGSWRATNVLDFVTWLIDTTNTIMSDTVLEPLDTSIFDSEKPCIFSHGDLVPENILIHDGHISGIIDWEWAGWYPYFWNAFIAQRRCPLYPVKTWTCWMEMVRHSMDTHDREWREFLWIYETASTYVGS